MTEEARDIEIKSMKEDIKEIKEDVKNMPEEIADRLN